MSVSMGMVCGGNLILRKGAGKGTAQVYTSGVTIMAGRKHERDALA